MQETGSPSQGLSHLAGLGFRGAHSSLPCSKMETPWSPSGKGLAGLQAFQALLTVTVTLRAGPGQSALGMGLSQYPSSLLPGHVPLESAIDSLPMLSWALISIPSRELKPQPGLRGSSGKTLWPHRGTRPGLQVGTFQQPAPAFRDTLEPDDLGLRGLGCFQIHPCGRRPKKVVLSGSRTTCIKTTWGWGALM